MKRLWLGLFLVATAWLPGTGYYRATDWTMWGLLTAAGVGLIGLSRLPWRGRPAAPLGDWADFLVGQQGGWGQRFALLALLAPAVWVFPWPYRLAPLLMAAATALAGWTGRNRKGPAEVATSPAPVGGKGSSDRPEGPGGGLHSTSCGQVGRPQPTTELLAGGLGVSAVVLGLQAVALLAYRTFTSYSHELLPPLPALLGGCLRWAGIEAGVEASALMLPTMRQVHALGATWELLVDPATWCFLVSGLVLTVPGAGRLRAAAPAAAFPPPPANRRAAKRQRQLPPARPSPWRRLTGSPSWQLGWAWAGAALLWLPLRVTLLAAVMIHRALLTAYEEPLDLMRPFWNTGVLLALGLPLVLGQARRLGRILERLCAATGRVEGPPPPPAAVAPPSSPGRATVRTLAPAWAGVGLVTLGVVWDPVGTRQAGRVAVDEYHSKWEPTDRPFDTEWYGHLSGYNYACIYDYASRFFQMSRLTAPLDEQTLAGLDVLVLKVPTSPYTPAEIEAVVRFVRRGGGLLLIGEHTDVFHTSHHLNAVARRFGFEFRPDCLFGIDSVFEQFYVPPLVPHPVVQHVRGMDFATSCSIRPFQPWRGRSVITSTGLKNAPADYHVSNFYPQAVDRADMRYGAFVQLWAARAGRGRVLGFTDSTIFSNFCTFEPGKAELMLGMLEWLNRRDRWGNVRPPLLGVGLVLLGLGVRRLRRRPELAGAALAGGAALAALVLVAVRTSQRLGCPPPAPQRPFVQVTIDRTLGEGPLSKNGFIEGKPDGFGIFERWILRLGYFTRREQGPRALSGDLVVFLHPSRPVEALFQAALERHVAGGGRVLVLDSAENTRSTAAALLAPFGLRLQPHPQPEGTLTNLAGLPAIPVQAALQVAGGTAFSHLHGRPVAAAVRHGRGTVTVLGLGARFTDARMGVTGDVEPDAALRQVYDYQFALLRRLVEGPWPPESEAPTPSPSPNATP